METIAKVRRLYFRDGLSQREISSRLRLNRRTINKYLNHEEAPIYKRHVQHWPKLGPFIEQLSLRLLEEFKQPVQQRLSARRHFEQLRSEGYEGQYSALCSFIRRFKLEHQSQPTSVFIPQSFEAGEAYQFGWSTEFVKLDSQVLKVNVAHFRLCYSRAFFIKAYPSQQMEMLIDAHNRAFAFWQGTPRRGIYDNMKTAVTRIGSGKDRTYNELFLCMMNHFLIEPVACTPAAGWEKGQVERQIKTLRRRLFEPMLSFSCLEALNDYLQQQCLQLMNSFRHTRDKNMSVAEVFEQERKTLIAYAPYNGYQAHIARVSHLSLVNFQNHRYSVPCHLIGRHVTMQIYAERISIIFSDKCVAEHCRSFTKNQTTYNPWHYLDALKRKPGALRNGEPFQKWLLPEPVKQLQQHLLGHPKGDRAMVQLLSLIAEYGEDIGVTAAAIALEEGMPTVEAVLNIIHRLTEPPIPELKGQDISLHTPPQVDCSIYNRLLSGEVNATH